MRLDPSRLNVVQEGQPATELAQRRLEGRRVARQPIEAGSKPCPTLQVLQRSGSIKT
jgi:hypothetical protein